LGIIKVLKEPKSRKNWGSGEWNSPDPQFFDNLLITGVRQARTWNDFEKAMAWRRANRAVAKLRKGLKKRPLQVMV
jgi:hypothetical protein